MIAGDVRLPALRESTPVETTATPLGRAIDALLFSGFWVAVAAAVLTAATSCALGAAPLPSIVALAFLGTLAVYAVDRLRDLARDGATAPVRSAFVIRHRRALAALSLASAAAASLCAISAGPRAIAISAGVLAVGLLHRRLKRWSLLQPVYVVCAWLAVVVGLPVAATNRAGHAGWIAALLAPALFANVAAPHALAWARLFAASGVLLAVFAPPPVRPLGGVALATGVALIGFRASERWLLGVLDGALVAGGIASLALGS